MALKSSIAPAMYEVPSKQGGGTCVCVYVFVIAGKKRRRMGKIIGNPIAMK